MSDKERIIKFIDGLIPSNFECGRISLTFNDDGSLLFTVYTREESEHELTQDCDS